MAVATESRRRASLSPALGDRRVLLAAGVSGLVVFLALLTWLAVPRDYLTGTNNTVGRIVAGQATEGQRFCLLGQTLPAGPGQIRFVGGSLTPAAPTTVAFDVT